MALLALLLLSLSAAVGAQPVPMPWIAQALPVTNGERYYDLRVVGDYILGYSRKPESPIQTIWYRGQIVSQIDWAEAHLWISNINPEGMVCGSDRGAPMIGVIRGASLIVERIGGYDSRGRVNGIVSPRVVVGVMNNHAVVWEKTSTGWNARQVLPGILQPSSVEVAKSTGVIAGLMRVHPWYRENMVFTFNLRSGEGRWIDGIHTDPSLRGLDVNGNLIGTRWLPYPWEHSPQGFFYTAFSRRIQGLRDLGLGSVFVGASYVHPTAIGTGGSLYGYYGCDGGFPGYSVWEKPFILLADLSQVDFSRVVGLPSNTRLTGVYGATLDGEIVALVQSGDDYKNGPRRPYLLSRGRIMPRPPAE